MRALRQAATAAIQRTAADLCPDDAERAGQLAMVIDQVFTGPAQGMLLDGSATLLEGLQAEITRQLAPLDDASLTGTGRSSADLLGVRAGILGEKLAGHLIREIVIRGARGGPLESLAAQLNHDVTHLQGQRLEVLFGQLASSVREVLVRLDDTPALTSGPPARAAMTGQAVVGDIPQQPPGFVRRVDLLAGLDAVGPGVTVVSAVTGMRGVGKTQLAAAYTRAKLAEGWDLVAWVNAEDPASLAGGLAAVAEAAGLARQSGDPGRTVRHWLEAGGGRCLLVFDNAADPDLLRPYLPAAGAARVLITSNRQSVADLGTPVGVEVFTQLEAAAFLAGRTGLADPAGAGELAAELGFLPLALVQAAAVIRGQHLPYGTYLERLRALPVAKYLIRGPGQPYPHGVAEAVLLSLQAVRAGDRTGACGRVLELLTMLSGAGVRRDLLYVAGQAGVLADGGDPLSAVVVDEALGRLAEWSLLTFSLDGQAVAAHRLVLRVVRDTLTARGRLAAVCRAAVNVLGARAGALMGSQDRPALRDIPEQVAALRQAATGLPDGAGELEEILLKLRLQALYHLGVLGESAQQAIAVGEPLTEDFERVLGPDHPDTLASRSNLAASYQETGRTAEAIPLFEQTLADRERVLGLDHLDTLHSRNNLAEAYRQAGRAAEAIPLFEQTLADRERVLGPDHPHTLASRNNLALAYEETGRAAEAISLHEQTLTDKQRVLGPDHPSTLTSRNNLANVYQDAGWTAEAIPLFEQTLADRERVLGPDHPHTLASRNNLATAYQETGRATDAIPLHEQILADRQRVLGPDHPDTLISQNNLATAYVEADYAAEAIPLFEQTLAAFERVLGPDHPATLRSRNNLTLAYRDAGRTK